MNGGGGEGEHSIYHRRGTQSRPNVAGGLRQPFDNDFDYCKYSTRASAPAHSQDYHVCRGSMLIVCLLVAAEKV